jgi:hypothetical protein
VSVRLRREIEVRFARHDDMHSIMRSVMESLLGGSRVDCAEMSVQEPMRGSWSRLQVEWRQAVRATRIYELILLSRMAETPGP